MSDKLYQPTAYYYATYLLGAFTTIEGAQAACVRHYNQEQANNDRGAMAVKDWDELKTMSDTAHLANERYIDGLGSYEYEIHTISGPDQYDVTHINDWVGPE